MNHYHDAAETEARYDHLDDLGLFDAATIREMTDYETDGSNEDFFVAPITARAGGELALKDLVENQKGGPNHSEWAKSNQDPAQAERNRIGLQNTRRALEQSRIEEQ